MTDKENEPFAKNLELNQIDNEIKALEKKVEEDNKLFGIKSDELDRETGLDIAFAQGLSEVFERREKISGECGVIYSRQKTNKKKIEELIARRREILG